MPPPGLDPPLLRYLCVPKTLWELFEFAQVKFGYVDGAIPVMVTAEEFGKWLEKTKLSDWRIILLTKLSAFRVEVPLPEEGIDMSDPEGHWRYLLGVAADYQAQVNMGEIKPPTEP